MMVEDENAVVGHGSSNRWCPLAFVLQDRKCGIHSKFSRTVCVDNPVVGHRISVEPLSADADIVHRQMSGFCERHTKGCGEASSRDVVVEDELVHLPHVFSDFFGNETYGSALREHWENVLHRCIERHRCMTADPAFSR